MEPAQIAGRCVESVGNVGEVDVQRPPDLQQPGAEQAVLVELDLADLFEPADVPRHDLVKIDIALAEVVLVDRDPVVGSRRPSIGTACSPQSPSGEVRRNIVKAVAIERESRDLTAAQPDAHTAPSTTVIPPTLSLKRKVKFYRISTNAFNSSTKFSCK